MTGCRLLLRPMITIGMNKKTAIFEIADFLAADAYRSTQITPISTRVNNPRIMMKVV